MSAYDRAKRAIESQLRTVEYDILDNSENWEDTLRLRGTRYGLVFALGALREANKEPDDDYDGVD